MSEIIYSNLTSKAPLVTDYCEFINGQFQYNQITEFLSGVGFSNFQIRPYVPENCPGDWNIDNCDCNISRECNGIFLDNAAGRDPVTGCPTDICVPDTDGCHYICAPDDYDNYFLSLIRSSNCSSCNSAGSTCTDHWKLVYNSCT
jgi:hypothetical protein